MAVKSKFVPKYEKVKQAILADIRNGKLKPSDKLPIREELIKQYNATRTTIDKALSGLIAQNILTASPRHGTFVAEKKLLQRIALVSWENSVIQHRNSFSDKHNYFSLFGTLLQEINNIELVDATAVEQNPHILDDYDYILWSGLTLKVLNQVVEQLNCHDKIILLNRYYEGFKFASTNHREAARNLTELFLQNLPAESIFYFLDMPTELPGANYVIDERKKGFLEACEKSRRFYRLLNINIASLTTGTPDVTALQQIQTSQAPAAIISPTKIFTGAAMRFMNEHNLTLNQELFYADFDNKFSVINTGYPIPSVLENFMDIAHAVTRIINHDINEYFVPSEIINNPFSKSFHIATPQLTIMSKDVINF